MAPQHAIGIAIDCTNDQIDNQNQKAANNKHENSPDEIGANFPSKSIKFSNSQLSKKHKQKHLKLVNHQANLDEEISRSLIKLRHHARQQPGPRAQRHQRQNCAKNQSPRLLAGRRSNLIASIVLPIIIFSSQLIDCSLNPVLDLNDTFSYLIEPETGKVIPPSEYMDFDNIYAPNETYRRNITAPARNYHLIKAFDFANYFRSDYWHYSSEHELRVSAEPIADPDRCEQQVDWILAQLTKAPQGDEVLFEPGQEHVNLMTLIDSYGKPDSATFSGHNLWIGSYYECTHVKVNMTQFSHESCLNEAKKQPFQSKQLSCDEQTKNLIIQQQQQQQNNILKQDASHQVIRGRYCMGKARDKDWPRDDRYHPQITYKIGLCLPETCQTLSIKTLQAKLDTLMKTNMPNFWKQRLNLTDIYCLPDERSPLRKLSPAGYVLLSMMLIWIVVILVATIIYACYKQNEKQLKLLLTEASHLEESKRTISNSLLKTGSNVTGRNGQDETNLLSLELLQKHNSNNQATPAKSISKSTLSLSNWLKESPMIIRFLKAISVIENMLEFGEPPKLLQEPGSIERCRINLNALDCIKCFCCIFVIFGHIIFIHMQHMTNIVHTIEMSYQTAPRIIISLFNFVDTFFIISGMLTAYFIFKRFNAQTFGNPLIWLYISAMRLLRLSPIYILVFWFTKTLSIHLSDGPLWDYATDKHSIKGLCKNDHWWKSLLYLGNLNTMQPLCILPAWSIIVDSQYSLIMPPIIFLVMKYRRGGYILMLVAIISSTINMSWQLTTQNAVKTNDMANIRLHVYPLISRFAAEFYNTAFNRIGPVAIGIVGGHALYLYDVGKIRQWPSFMRGLGFKLILMMHLFIMMLPTLGKLTHNPSSKGETDLTIFIMSNAAIKPIWSLVNTILLLRLITDLRRYSVVAQLMSHNLWHCLGKLCFISYLIHYEIILVLLKSRLDGLVDPNWSNVGREFSYAFLVSTALSYCVYILFEAPINNLVVILTRVREQLALRKTVDGTLDNSAISGSNENENGCLSGESCARNGPLELNRDKTADELKSARLIGKLLNVGQKRSVCLEGDIVLKEKIIINKQGRHSEMQRFEGA